MMRVEMLSIKTSRADLERKKIIFAEIGLILVLIMVYLVFNIRTESKKPPAEDLSNLRLISEEIVPVTVHQEKPPPPPVPMAVTNIRVVDDDIEVEEDIEIDVEATQETILPEYVPVFDEDIKEEEELREDAVFVVVESMPSFPGGLTALMEYLQTSIRYPVLARESNIKGTVYVTFVIEKDGTVNDVRVLRGIGGGCDQEAVRVVQNMPAWIPGKQRNVAVRVRYNLPIRFVLQ